METASCLIQHFQDFFSYHGELIGEGQPQGGHGVKGAGHSGQLLPDVDVQGGGGVQDPRVVAHGLGVHGGHGHGAYRNP